LEQTFSYVIYAESEYFVGGNSDAVVSVYVINDSMFF